MGKMVKFFILINCYIENIEFTIDKKDILLSIFVNKRFTKNLFGLLLLVYIFDFFTLLNFTYGLTQSACCINRCCYRKCRIIRISTKRKKIICLNR